MEEFVYTGKAVPVKKMLTDYFPQLSYNTVNKLIRNRDIKVNGVRITTDTNVTEGDRVTVYVEVKYYTPVYADQNIVIISKNIGIEVEGDNSLVTKLLPQYPTIRAVHRIDRNTKGLVVFALNDESERELVSAFRHRTVDKLYLARVMGVPRQKEAELVAYLIKDNSKSEVKVLAQPRHDARRIVTAYKVLEDNGDESLLEVRLITGATHQIRAHLAFIGHPLVGDNKYGKVEFNKQKSRRFQELTAHKMVFHLDKGVLSYLDGTTFLDNL